MTKTQLLIAKIIFIISALSGLVASAFIGYAFTDSFSMNGIIIFLIFATLAIAFNYTAYLGLTEQSLGLSIIFWIYVILNLFNIPIGTIFAITLIYFWNKQKKPRLSSIQTKSTA